MDSAEPQAKRKKPRGKPFTAKNNANPGGRPKQPKEFKDIVRANTVTALNAVLGIMNDEGAKPADRLKASEIIIDRAYGKAAQPIVGDKDFDAIQQEVRDLSKLTKEELVALAGLVAKTTD